MKMWRTMLLVALTLLALGAPARPLTAQGTQSHWKTGAAVGGVVGAVGTFVLLNQGGSTNPCDSSANQDAMGTSACLGIAALGGLAGALIGGLIGSRVRSEAQAIRLGVLPPTGGRPFGFSVAFTPPRR